MSEGKKDGLKQYTAYEMASIIERLCAFSVATSAHDYGTGEQFTSTEVHILSYIAENLGITVTEIAYKWNRTKGAISQVIKKLEHKKLIYRKKMDGNDKTVCLFVTDKGKKLDAAHQKYDTGNYERFLVLMEAYFSMDEINHAFEIFDVWVTLAEDFD